MSVFIAYATASRIRDLPNKAIHGGCSSLTSWFLILLNSSNMIIVIIMSHVMPINMRSAQESFRPSSKSDCWQQIELHNPCTIVISGDFCLIKSLELVSLLNGKTSVKIWAITVQIVCSTLRRLISGRWRRVAHARTMRKRVQLSRIGPLRTGSFAGIAALLRS